RKGPFIMGGVAIGTVLALAGVEGHIVGYLSLLGVLIPPLGGVLIGDWIARWRAGQPALETLTEKVRWQALVPYVAGCVVAWVSNEHGIGIAPLNGIVGALVGAWALGVPAARGGGRARGWHSPLRTRFTPPAWTLAPRVSTAG